MPVREQPIWRRAAVWLGGYTGFAVFAVLSGWIALQLRTALIEIVFVRSGSVRAVAAVDKWSVLVLAIGWVVVLVVLNHTMGVARERGRLLRWTLLVGGSELTAYLIVLGLRWFLA